MKIHFSSFIPFFLPSLLSLPRFSFDGHPPSLKLMLSCISSLTGIRASGAFDQGGSSQALPKKRHPAGGNRGDEGLEDNPRYVQDPPVERSHILYWYPGCRQAGCYWAYSVKLTTFKRLKIWFFLALVVLSGHFIWGCWLLYLCNSENIGARAKKGKREEGRRVQ